MPSSTSNSKNTYHGPKSAYFDPEHVERPVPDRPWRSMAIAAFVGTILLVFGWELYWRANWHVPGDMKNTAALWAQERRKAKGDTTVFIGSSRIFFDVDLDVWEEVSGIRPVQLALEGTSPVTFLANLANDEEFYGLVVVGVAVPLLFTGYTYRDEVLDYVRNESPSQRVGHILAKHYDKTFAYFDDETRPKRLLYFTDLPLREGMVPRVDVHKLAIHSEDRNTEVWSRIMEDEQYRDLAKYVWAELLRREAPPPGPNGEPPVPMPDEAINAVISDMKKSVDKIRARGGDVAFMRLPYEGAYTDAEDMGFPRERFWDRLVREMDSVGLAWQDHPEMQGYYLPEWSHIAPREAEEFTRKVVPVFYRALEKKREERAN